MRHPDFSEEELEETFLEFVDYDLSPESLSRAEESIDRLLASALPIRLEQPPDYREALEDLDNAQGRWIKARIDYPYSDIDIDQAKEDYKAAIKQEEARRWG